MNLIAPLKHFQQKWEPVLRRKMRKNKELEQFPKSVTRFSDKNCGENKELEQFTEPSETKTALAPTKAQIDDLLETVLNNRRGYWGTVFNRLYHDPAAFVCGIILVTIFCCAIFAPWIGLYDPAATNMGNRLKPIATPGHLLGTDELGRDMLSRLIYGGRYTLMLGLSSVFFSFVIGTALGVFAGYIGGMVNNIIMRLVDIFFAFPSILLAIAISGALGAGILNIIVSMTIVFVPKITRVAEGVTTSVRALSFVDAARLSGAHPFTVVRVHVLGNVLSPIFVYATSMASIAMILAAGLSFLGLGVRPPEAEWGLMLNTLRTALYIDPLLAILPGIMIFITSLCLNLLSDSLRKAMNIKE